MCKAMAVTGNALAQAGELLDVMAKLKPAQRDIMVATARNLVFVNDAEEEYRLQREGREGKGGAAV